MIRSESTQDPSSNVATSVALMLPALVSLYKQNIDRIIQPFGISGGQSTLLMLLNQKDGQLQKDLARRLNVKAPSLTAMINRMERAGMLERRKTDRDHRACRVYLTHKGLRASKRINAVIRFLNERNLAGFRSEEKLLLLRFLSHMMANLEKQRDELAMISVIDPAKKARAADNLSPDGAGER